MFYLPAGTRGSRRGEGGCVRGQPVQGPGELPPQRHHAGFAGPGGLENRGGPRS